MGLELTQDQLNTIKVIAKNEGINCYTLDIKSAISEGDGYSGSILSIAIHGEKNTLQLILKEAAFTENQALRVFRMFRRKSYLREIYIYNSVLREFQIFQKESNILHGFIGFAKMFGSNDSKNIEYLILENLKESGYKMWDRKIPMNSEHVAAVFSEYGKFHAVSLAMREKKSNKYQELAEHLGDFYSSSLPRKDASLTIKYKLQIGFEAVEGDVRVSKLFQSFAEGAEKFILEDIEVVEDQLVVTHSDCWCNNILFKYENSEDPKDPSKVCFLDWQLSKMGSPVLDLAYFFFACATGETLYYYKKYLKIYHDTVCELLSEFSCDVEKVFPYTLLEYHWNKYAKYGLYTALMTINLTLLDTNKNSDKTNSENLNRIDIKYRNQRIRNIVNFMADNNLI